VVGWEDMFLVVLMEGAAIYHSFRWGWERVEKGWRLGFILRFLFGLGGDGLVMIQRVRSWS
jgi:hypothetical protein